ncbi:MAG: hypothetical protein JW737_09950 [Acidobacteria bacterium]|nr:hypothetical protein [Acidobacteriota bacterium]
MGYKAVGLFSGGLDSYIAVKLIQEQSIEITALVIDLWSHERTVKNRLSEDVKKLGIEYRYEEITSVFLERLMEPWWGYGTAVNPCIDCKFLMMVKAKEVMEEIGAEFVFTGEVLGQRPMTQNKQVMNMLEKKTGLEGRLLRPLSAKLLKPTEAEKAGIIDRNKLLDIQGRGRNRQFEFAKSNNITGYHPPGGGCILTYREYAAKVLDFINYSDKAQPDPEDMEIYKYGRHFRISRDLKIIVGKDDEDNSILEEFSEGRGVIDLRKVPGPLVLLEGAAQGENLETAASIALRYSKIKKDIGTLVVYISSDGKESSVATRDIKDDELERLRIKFDRNKLEEIRRKTLNKQRMLRKKYL